eukprot:SM000354S13408  [mRNA]  locus=s354:28525:33934:- [translate_table: standard]
MPRRPRGMGDDEWELQRAAVLGEKDEDEEWNFPHDPHNWREGDMDEDWIDAPDNDPAPGADPVLDELDLEVGDREARKEAFDELVRKGEKPPSDVYVPYRHPYPAVPEDDVDIVGPEGVIEELERAEEFLDWASYVFADGSQYEGTVWDDNAHGKGVYVTPHDLCRYEGEWFQNGMDGHGVLTVDIPVPVPAPDSDAANAARQRGFMLEDDLLTAEEKAWLKSSLEDEERLAQEQGLKPQTLFEDDESWVAAFGEKPEKGHYKYAGQWKQNRMHGCGVYEVNGRQLWGKFYFGEILPDKDECNQQNSAFHAAMAEVAANKARMFVNKPDGMVREAKGPYTDPQHPYMYDEGDEWMAPGFINQFHKIPKTWLNYVKEVDKECKMWLKSFTHAPLRLPMPPELEQLWSKEEEFVVLGNVPGPIINGRADAEDVARAQPGLEGDVLLHVPSKQIINWAEDKDGQMHFFVQPFGKDAAVNPKAVRVLPKGFKEFLGEEDEEEEVGETEPRTEEEAVADFERRLQRQKERNERRWDEKERALEERWREADEDRQERWAEEDEDREEELQLRREEQALQADAEEEGYRIRQQELLEKAVRRARGESAAPVDGKERAGRGDDSKEDVKEDGGRDVEIETIAALENGGPFHTVFASISLSSQVAMQHALSKVAASMASWIAPPEASQSPLAVAGLPQALLPVEMTVMEPCSVGLRPLRVARLSLHITERANLARGAALPRKVHKGMPATSSVLAALADCVRQRGSKLGRRVPSSQSFAKNREAAVTQQRLSAKVELLSLAIPVD